MHRLLKAKDVIRIIQSFAESEHFLKFSDKSFFIIENSLIKSFSIFTSQKGFLYDVHFSVSPLCGECLHIGYENIPLSGVSKHPGPYWIGSSNEKKDYDLTMSEIIKDMRTVMLPFFQRCSNIETSKNEILLLLKTTYKLESILWVPELYELATAALDYDLMYQCMMIRYKTNLEQKDKMYNGKKVERIKEIIRIQEQELYHIKIKDDQYFLVQANENKRNNIDILDSSTKVWKTEY